jgi:hypothetical protein
MLAVQGYFQSGRFITDTPIQIPERKKTIITVLCAIPQNLLTKCFKHNIMNK